MLCHENNDAWEEDAPQNECKRVHDCSIVWMIELKTIEQSFEAWVQILPDFIFQGNSMDSLSLDVIKHRFHLYGNWRFVIFKIGP